MNKVSICAYPLSILPTDCHRRPPSEVKVNKCVYAPIPVGTKTDGKQSDDRCFFFPFFLVSNLAHSPHL